MSSEIGRTSSGSSLAVQDGSSSAAENVGWANLPRDLVPAIMWRVMGSEDSWRRSTVACAGVCQHWRTEVEEFLGLPRGSGMRALLLSSDPSAKLVRDVVEHATRDAVEHAMYAMRDAVKHAMRDVVEDAIRNPKDKVIRNPKDKVIRNPKDKVIRNPKDKAMNDVTKAADEFVVSLADQKVKTMNDVTKAADDFVVSLADQISKMTSFLRSRRIAGALEASQEHVERDLQIFRFENKQLSRAVKEATFELLITKLFGILDVQRTRHIGIQMRSPLNDLLPEILDNVDRTSSFVVLISLLRSSKQPSLAGNREFHDLVIQCLMRYTLNIKSSPTVELGSVLFSIHEYLQELGMETIRNAIVHSPPQMILTVLQELVKFLGTAIKRHLSRIPKDTNPKAIIIVYINLYLQTLAPSRRRLGLPP